MKNKNIIPLIAAFVGVNILIYFLLFASKLNEFSKQEAKILKLKKHYTELININKNVKRYEELLPKYENIKKFTQKYEGAITDSANIKIFFIRLGRAIDSEQNLIARESSNVNLGKTRERLKTGYEVITYSLRVELNYPKFIKLISFLTQEDRLFVIRRFDLAQVQGEKAPGVPTGGPQPIREADDITFDVRMVIDYFYFIKAKAVAPGGG